MDLKAVHQVFLNKIIRIPSYQRGYSWTNNRKIDLGDNKPLKGVKGQLIDLWEDITIYDKWHYLGVITLVEDEKDHEWLDQQQYAIVDGQQRITSLVILLKVLFEKADELDVILKDKDGGSREKYLIADEKMGIHVFGYNADNPSDKFFRKHILNYTQKVEGDFKESVYTENLKNAKVFFRKVLEYHLKEKCFSEIDGLKKLFHRVTNDLKLNEYILPEELDEFVVFETMNNRGKPISVLEKLKNRLMYLNSKFVHDNNNEARADDLKESLEQDINQAWISVYQELGANKNRPLDDDEFLKNHWIMYFKGYSRDEANVYENDLFHNRFTQQKIDEELDSDAIKEYVSSLQKCSRLWKELTYPTKFLSDSPRIQGAIQGVKRAGLKSSFKPVLMAILNREDRDEFIGVINLLEEYSFKVFDISDRRSNTGDSKFYRLSNKIFNKKMGPDETNREIKKYIDTYYEIKLFKNQSKELFSTGKKQGFYKWSGIKYFLYKYDNYLRQYNNNESTRENEINWEVFKQKDTIEHIYPRSAAKSLEKYAQQDNNKNKSSQQIEKAYNKIQANWESFDDQKYTPEQRKRLSNSLGNLLALSSGDNSSFGNDPFEFKVDKSNKPGCVEKKGYRYNSMSAHLVADYLEEGGWTPETIAERGIKMLDFLLDELDEEKDFSKSEKLKILGLDFMKEDSKEEELAAELS